MVKTRIQNPSPLGIGKPPADPAPQGGIDQKCEQNASPDNTQDKPLGIGVGIVFNKGQGCDFAQIIA
jgi:hypothetical protein